jgi:hypothetical protein
MSSPWKDLPVISGAVAEADCGLDANAGSENRKCPCHEPFQCLRRLAQDKGEHILAMLEMGGPECGCATCLTWRNGESKLRNVDRAQAARRVE